MTAGEKKQRAEDNKAVNDAHRENNATTQHFRSIDLLVLCVTMPFIQVLGDNCAQQNIDNGQLHYSSIRITARQGYNECVSVSESETKINKYKLRKASHTKLII